MKPENELSLDEIEKFASKAAFLTWINLTGGELFLREDLVEICRIFSTKCSLFLLNFATNGLLPKIIPERVEQILSLPIPRVIIGVSLDGSETLNDEIRGISGDWKKGLQTYQSLRELAQKYSKFRTYLGYTLSPYNKGKFFEFYDSLKKEIPELKPRDIHLNLYHHSPHYYHVMNGSSAPAVEMEELEKIIKFKSEFSLNPVDLLEKYYLKLAKSYVQSGKTPLPCHAVSTSCFVDSWGNVFPCTIYEKKLGSLRESDYDLPKILHGNIALEAKKEAQELKCPNCWTPCEAYQMILTNLLKQTSTR